MDCTSLKGITLPNSLTKIFQSAFENVRSLRSVVIPNSVTKLGYGAFTSCYSLYSVTISNSLTTIRPVCGCGVPLRSRFSTRLRCAHGMLSTRAHPQATFALCKSLQSVNIPDSVTKIFPVRARALSRAQALSSVRLRCSTS